MRSRTPQRAGLGFGDFLEPFAPIFRQTIGGQKITKKKNASHRRPNTESKPKRERRTGPKGIVDKDIAELGEGSAEGGHLVVGGLDLGPVDLARPGLRRVETQVLNVCEG